MKVAEAAGIPAPPPVSSGVGQIAGPPLPETLPRVCRADAVFVGHLVAQRAYLNKSETHLFTVFSVAVDQWIRPDTGADTVEFSQGTGTAVVAGKEMGSYLTGDPFSSHPTGSKIYYLRTATRMKDAGFLKDGDPIDLSSRGASSDQLLQSVVKAASACR